jgi:hypothetical protein
MYVLWFSLKECLSGALSVATAAMFAVSLLFPPPVDAASRRTAAHTVDGGGSIYARITWSPNKGGNTYHGTIEGYYEDRWADGYCVLGLRSGSVGQPNEKWYPLGPSVCPKGSNHRFVYHYKAATKAGVKVCLLNKRGNWIRCSGPK